jgi:hypothetical protein
MMNSRDIMATSFACECVVGFYNECGECKQCDISCKTCNGSTSNDCLSCYANASLNAGACACDSGYSLVAINTSLSVCQQACAQGEYKDHAGQCHSCNPLCSSCTGPNKHECTGCIGTAEKYKDAAGNKSCRCPANMYWT